MSHVSSREQAKARSAPTPFLLCAQHAMKCMKMSTISSACVEDYMTKCGMQKHGDCKEQARESEERWLRQVALPSPFLHVIG